MISDAARDLVLGAACVGCRRPGRVLCPACDAGLPRRGRVSWPTPTPAGLATPYAAGAYEGLLKAMVNEHKEHGVLGLAPPLGRVLCDVVHDLLTDETVGDLRRPVLLVPVPSRRSVVRRRGHDPLLRVTREASRRLRRQGVPASVGRLLVAAAPVRDQSTLGSRDRALNLAGTMRARDRREEADTLVVVVDDVLTTGSTAREAQRALERAGLAVAGVAAVAATVRRSPPPGDTGQSPGFLSFSVRDG